MNTSDVEPMENVNVASAPAAPPHDPLCVVVLVVTVKRPPGALTGVAPVHVPHVGHPSSTIRSQSSSTPLKQISAGGAQASHSQLAQRCVPLDPHVVVQPRMAPLRQEKPSSTFVSQSSSRSLQVSTGGVHAAAGTHAALQLRVPVLPHTVVHAEGTPAQQPKPSSHVPSQSSSRPLQVSAGGVHVPNVQLDPHERVPLDPHVVVHVPVLPTQHAKPSSHAPLQSSSTPLHVSAGGEQIDQPHVAPQVRSPVVPQVVTHMSVVPRQHVDRESQPPVQSLSRPSHTSGAPGSTSARRSSQSVAATPPIDGHIASPAPSPSKSRVV
jgi:hypothetical protein